MLRDELVEILDPVLQEVQAHPFWAGLREGSLAISALLNFVQQDTAFLLPGYARALARCASRAVDDRDTALLGRSIIGTLDARDRLRRSAVELADVIGLPALAPAPEITPTTLAHTSFLAAATAGSFHSGLGALLPMVWCNAEVADTLREEVVPGSRYEPWIEAYHPGASYRYAVEAFLEMVDRAGHGDSGRHRRSIIEQFSIGVGYELAFAESCQPAREGATR